MRILKKVLKIKECEEIFKDEQEQRTKELCENIKKRSNECEERFIEEMKKDIE
ncbi:hypothetical protein BTM418_14920 [Helicobacter pylori]